VTVALHDFPALTGTIGECVDLLVLELEFEPDLARIGRKILRIHALYPDSVRVVWTVHPNAQARGLVDHAWRTLRPKGQLEHFAEGEFCGLETAKS
jgi:hypothetical protein